MGLMGTLAKVAIGYAAARGVDKLAGGGGLGTLLGGGAQIKGESDTASLQSQMASMLGGGGAEGASNPMAGMMEQLQQGGLGALMGGGAGGGANPLSAMMEKMQGGGMDLSALMGAMGGGAQGSDTGAAGGGLLSALGGGGAGLAGLLAAAGAQAQGQGAAGLLDAMDTQTSAPEAEEAAGLMLRAMIMAAKSDGGIDASEQAKILETVGDDADESDRAFIQAELAAPVDPEGLAAQVPAAQRPQVYAASLMTIRVDTQAEAAYLDALARAMGLDEATVNMLHMQMGMQPLYT